MGEAARPVLLMVRALSTGGCERDLAKMALALDRSKYEPHVACFLPEGPRRAELVAAGIPILHLPVKSFTSWSAVRGAWKMWRYIRRHRIQVMHAFDVPTDLFGAPVAKLSGVPAIITCQLSFRYMFAPAERRLLKITDQLSNRIVVNSKAAMQDLVTAEGVPADRITVSYNGVDCSKFCKDPQSRLVEEVATASLVIGTVCVLRQEKRLDQLLESFARVRVMCPGMKLLIVGSGDKLGAWQEIAARLGLGESCVFVPEQQEVVPWFRSIDIFVMPSESESFPNALLEAMACGCCVISSRVGGIPELVTDGQNGLLFDALDTAGLERNLRLAIQDRDLRKRLGDAAQETAHRDFSMTLAARRTEKLYDELLDRAGHRAGSRP